MSASDGQQCRGSDAVPVYADEPTVAEKIHALSVVRDKLDAEIFQLRMQQAQQDASPAYAPDLTNAAPAGEDYP